MFTGTSKQHQHWLTIILYQPTAAKIADVFGRVELIIVSIIFYTVGTIIETFSKSVEAFCAGAVIYQVST